MMAPELREWMRKRCEEDGLEVTILHGPLTRYVAHAPGERQSVIDEHREKLKALDEALKGDDDGLR